MLTYIFFINNSNLFSGFHFFFDVNINIRFITLFFLNIKKSRRFNLFDF